MIITQSKPSTDSPHAVVGFHYEPSPAEPAPQALDPGKILVSFLFAPINPQDLLVLAGRYPVKPAYSHDGEPILGHDGVARVEAVGSGLLLDPSSDGGGPALRQGDLVIPRRHGLGTLRSRAVLDAVHVIRLSPTDDLIGASLLRMAFLPAYLLVEDVVVGGGGGGSSLKPGDWIVQNAGSGTIARLVAQFARIKGVRTASVLASRGVEAHPDLASAAGRNRVVLAIDGVFGEAGERLASLLSHGGTYVNYGSLGGADGAVRLSQRLLFWSEVRFRNFRLSEQLGQRTPAQIESTLLWFQGLLARGVLVTPKVRRIPVPVPVSTGDQAEFEERVGEAVSLVGDGGIGNVKRVLEFKRITLTTGLSKE
ncbi:Enoyl-[acyl-carrier-protein] reductase [Colletotrichum shisoi]|uniref:enoyl-[acyl-carrier-protein] reductase n=1 Tax=Colletotrichum shisoi TaxID=2078593 RepID=A0A5Q4BAH1_9PEZI|nr:Enoyl-[acyl-carrier-protein] reductase [Colletotrichum shisoi]